MVASSPIGQGPIIIGRKFAIDGNTGGIGWTNGKFVGKIDGKF